MYLSHLSLTNFRVFHQLDWDLAPGVVVLYGGNAQGKTCLLEAIYLLSVAKSCRAENENEVVNWDARKKGANALVAGAIEKRSEKMWVYIGYQSLFPSESPPPSAEREGWLSGAHGTKNNLASVRKQIRVNRIQRTASQLVGLVNAVLFTAEDIELVQGAPSLRRRYLDILMSQVDPSYLRSLQHYQRVLQQRNRLLRFLRDGRAEGNELTFWNNELVEKGSWIVERRLEAMTTLSDLSRQMHSELTGGGEELHMEYAPSIPQADGVWAGDSEIKERFVESLEASRRRELAMGSTVVGPHRDDFKLLVNDMDMETYASRGQARTISLSRRLAEAAYVASIRGEEPIVLLDDVLSELDAFRRDRVIEKAVQYQQVIITTTDLQLIQKSPLTNAVYFEVEKGFVNGITQPGYTATTQP